MNFRKIRPLSSWSDYSKSKKYKGIYTIQRESDKLITGYYYSTTVAGKVKRVRADIPTDYLNTKKPNSDAVELAITAKTKASLNEDGGKDTSSKDLILDDLMELYFEERRKEGKNEKGIIKDRNMYESRTPQSLRRKKISKITSSHINDVKYELEKAGLAKGTVINYLVFMQGAFNFADKNNKDTKRPFKDIDVKKPKAKTVALLTDEQVQDLFKRADETGHPDIGFHFRMLYYLAQRPATIHALTKRDVNLAKNHIFIKSIKNQEERYLQIPDKLRPILEERCKGLEPDERLEKRSPSNIQKWAVKLFKPLNIEANIPKEIVESGNQELIDAELNFIYKNHRERWLSRYSFRHTSATKIYESTGDLYATQKILNHSTPQMTERYAQMRKDREREVLNVL